MTSQAGKQIITMHIFPNISSIKTNQAKEFGQFIEYNMRSIFFKNHAENEARILVPDVFL